MYGIIIEGVRYMIEDHYGTATLSLVLERAHLANLTFSTHDRYSEKIIPNLLVALGDITGNSVEEVGILAGRYFVRFMMKYGHAELLKILGRRFSDFLKGLDSLHEYFRFSYPRIRPPSFYCDRETTDGLTLHYRSRRSGYISYVMGQLIEIAKVFFEQEINVELVRKEEKKGFQYVLLRVTFDNKDYNTDQLLRDKNTALNEFLPVDSLSVLTMFPYFIAFNKRMEIVVVGKALSHIIPELIGKRIDEEFDLIRPCVKFTWDACHHHLNNLFELETMYPVTKKLSNASIALAVNDQVEEKVKLDSEKPQMVNGLPNGITEADGDDNLNGSYLHLKGPMVYLKHSEINLYLPTVLIENLDDLFDLGLYLNDYSSSDCNREIIMASVQKSDDLKELLKKEKEKSRTLAKNMKDIDLARKTAKELLSQMMPKEIANELLQSGKRSVTLCESFDEVTLAFAKVVDFNGLTGDMPPMGVVSLLNTCFSLFDDVVSKHGVYKVETIGESYMISCGVPYPTQNHAEYIGDTALDMIKAIESISTTAIDGKVVTVKIGMHSGSVVGGVVGLRAPRYCLFGDTVNCASRLESHNKQPMSIQASVKTKVLLENTAPGQYVFENRGKINLKGKGEMLAFSLMSKKGAPRSEKHPLFHSGTVDDEDAASDVYTPMDAYDEGSRASTMSRMSISMAGSRARSGGSRSSNSRASMHDSDEGEITPRDKSAGPGELNSLNTPTKTAEEEEHEKEDGKVHKRKLREISKDRKKKAQQAANKQAEKKEKAQAHQQTQKEKSVGAEAAATASGGGHHQPHHHHSEAEPDLSPQMRAQQKGSTVIRGAETLGASTSNKSFLSIHNQSAHSGFEKPPPATSAEKTVPPKKADEPEPPSKAPQPQPPKPAPAPQAAAPPQPQPPPKKSPQPNGTAVKEVTTESANLMTKMKQTKPAPAAPVTESPKMNGSLPIEETVKVVKASVAAAEPPPLAKPKELEVLKSDTPAGAKATANGSVKTGAVRSLKGGTGLLSSTSVESVGDEELGMKQLNLRSGKSTPPPSVLPEEVTRMIKTQIESAPNADTPAAAGDSSISKLLAAKSRRQNTLVTADQIKEEARSIVANQMKAMEEILKPAPLVGGKLGAAALPPISSLEEELGRLNTNKKPMANGGDTASMLGNGVVVAVISENLPAECICGRYKEAQVIKTKACSLM